MTFFYVMLAAIFTVLLVILVKRRSEPARIERYQQEFRKRYEETLSIEETEIVSEALIEKLNKALDIEYMEKVNTDFRLKYPRYSQTKVNTFWRELKRYMIMTAVFGKTEMFHAEIDELWHGMLSDQRNYNDFCHGFIGQRVQHHSHSQPVFKPNERTLFDFYYIQLFTVDSHSILLWGKFFKHDKGKETLQEFQTLALEQLKDKYMRKPTSVEAEQTFEKFTHHLKENDPKTVMDWQTKFNETHYAAPAYLIYANSDDYDSDFKHIFGNDAATESSAGNGSHNNDHNGHDSGSGSSSCSSCSSCSS